MTKAVLPEGHTPADMLRLGAMRTLEAAVHACTACALAAGRRCAVPGEGNLNAPILFVGEGPGQEEDRQGRPFVGRSGQLLTDLLHRVGIDRRDVFITNVVKCRPPNNRDPLPAELDACAGYLEQQVALVNPRIIVTLGRFSMRRWFPQGSITQLHGQVCHIEHGRVAIPMFHPAAALRNPQWLAAMERDMQLLPRLLAQGAEPHPGPPQSGEGEGACDTDRIA